MLFGGEETMAKYFYYDDKGEKHGAFSGKEIKALAKGGLIKPETILETEDGKKYTAQGNRWRGIWRRTAD